MPQKSSSLIPQGLIESLFGNERDRFAEGIKRRRMEEDLADHGMQVPTVNDMPVMGMTKYVAKGIPQVAERIAGTNAFTKGMEALGLGEKAAEFTKRFPRIAAHMQPYETRMKDVNGITDIGQAFRADPAKVPVGFNLDSVDDMAGTIAHEGTHVAQTLGSGRDRFAQLYSGASDLLEKKYAGLKSAKNLAYQGNPYELSANRAALRKTTHPYLPPTPSGPYMTNVVKESPAGDPVRSLVAELLLSRR